MRWIAGVMLLALGAHAAALEEDAGGGARGAIVVAPAGGAGGDEAPVTLVVERRLTRAEWRDIEAALAKKGYGVLEDGKVDPGDLIALEDFRRDAGLPAGALGRIDAATIERLGEEGAGRRAGEPREAEPARAGYRAPRGPGGVSAIESSTAPAPEPPAEAGPMPPWMGNLPATAPTRPSDAYPAPWALEPWRYGSLSPAPGLAPRPPEPIPVAPAAPAFEPVGPPNPEVEIVPSFPTIGPADQPRGVEVAPSEEMYRGRRITPPLSSAEREDIEAAIRERRREWLLRELERLDRE